MSGRKAENRMWLSEKHDLWRDWVAHHPRNQRFAPYSKYETKSRG